MNDKLLFAVNVSNAVSELETLVFTCLKDETYELEILRARIAVQSALQIPWEADRLSKWLKDIL